MAMLGRNLGLCGCIGFLLTEALFLLYQCEELKRISQFLSVIIVLIGAFDLMYLRKASNIAFIRVNYRTCYYGINTISIGAVSLWEAAKQLEMAGKEENGDYIIENHQIVLERYTELLQKLRSAI